MTNLSTRGIKRVCQSETCALPFYDLNRTDISCPNCGTVFDATVVIHARTPPSSSPAWKRGSRGFQRVAPTPVAAEEPADLPEVDEDDTIDADADTLILEEDSDAEVAGEIKPPADDRADV